MHQPIYWPYEPLNETIQHNPYNFSLLDVHNSRAGAYTTWPKDAVMKGASDSLPHFGAQVSFSGSLIENLNSLEAAGDANFANWKSNWNVAGKMTTSLGNPRLDMVAFGYFHPLMGLLDYSDIRRQIEMHKEIFSAQFPGVKYSKGIFPPENAFSERMIPALVDEGIQWALVDNIHFERACKGYPYSTAGNLYEVNQSDMLNPDPGDWVHLDGLWEPTQVSARWARQPHYSQYTDPETGEVKKIIVVPGDRYLGIEDGRGGYGALLYEKVMSQLESYNTDPRHPILIVLAHDGDNYGGGTSGYYNSNFQNFVDWVKANPSRFVCSTIQDYLQMFPPDESDVIHVESGSWSGADNGDPEFMKWLGKPSSNGYSSDRNSWGVITAAKNYVETAESAAPNDDAVKKGMKYLMCGEASCYWYWDGTLNGLWDSHPARAANLAVNTVAALVSSSSDKTAPTIFLPQREPYNPGTTEWKIAQSSDFKVWTYVYDRSGLKSVKIKYRTDNDSLNPAVAYQNEIYKGGDKVSNWIEKEMTGVFIEPLTDPTPVKKALEYSASITGVKNRLVDYYVEAVDSCDNMSRSPIMHVWVGNNSSTGGNTGSATVSWSPKTPTVNDTIKITIKNASAGAKLHWGVNNSGSIWQAPDQIYWPAGSSLYGGSGPAVETPFLKCDSSGCYSISVGPFNNSQQRVNSFSFVIHYANDSWDNNGGGDYSIDFGSKKDTTVTPKFNFVMDGLADTSSFVAATDGTMKLLLGWNGRDLYVASQSAQSCGSDVFIFISNSKNAMLSAPWGKAGKVAGWSAFIANESSNNYCAWTGRANGTASGSTVKAGSFVEGTLDVYSQFGSKPDCLYISAARYATADGGALKTQLPAGNSDGNIDDDELLEFKYVLPLVSVTERGNHNPSAFALAQNYPNPFNPSTRISFSIPYRTNVELKIYDVMGREVASLIKGLKEAGEYTVNFNAKELSSGIYFYRLRAGSFNAVKKMILIR
jgi:hypothetical protein